jgi:hypothetical protein
MRFRRRRDNGHPDGVGAVGEAIRSSSTIQAPVMVGARTVLHC